MITYRSIITVMICLSLLAGSAIAQETIEAPARKVPVLYDVDVVVIGGGLSGSGAALGAAKTGAKTLVVERTGYLGGWIRGTGLGNVLGLGGWRPAVNEGVLLDLNKKLIEMGAVGDHKLDEIVAKGGVPLKNYETIPQAFQSLILDAGGQILYFSTYSDSVVKDGKIQAIIVDTPVGRAAVKGKIFIDCTGTATVAAESGAPIKHAEAAMGLATSIGGVDLEKFEEWSKTRPKEGSPELRKWVEAKIGYKITTWKPDTKDPTHNDYPWDDWWSRNSGPLGDLIQKAVDNGEMDLFYTVGSKGKIAIIEGLKPTKTEWGAGLARPRTYIVGVDPGDIKAVTEAHIKSTRLLFQYVRFLKQHVPGFEKANFVRIADTTLNRAGRSIDNDAAPAEGDIQKPIPHDDVICILKRGKNGGEYEVPYSAMLPQKIDNLLAVGKSSSGGIAFRTHMLSVIMGQAAGTAAAVAAHDGVSATDVNIRKVQAELRRAGIPLPDKPEQPAK